MLTCRSGHAASPRGWAKLLQEQRALHLPQKKVAQKKDRGEQPVASEPAQHSSRCHLGWGIFIMEFGSHKAAWSCVDSTPGLQCDINFSPALIAFQVMIKPGRPHRWVCARLCWFLSHTRFPVPRSHDRAQLLCWSSRKLSAKSTAGQRYSPPLCMNMHDSAVKTVCYQVQRPLEDTQRCFSLTHIKVR